MKIGLVEAHSILNLCPAVIYDGIVTIPSLAELEGSDENEFLHLSWEINGEYYSTHFCEGENENVVVEGSVMKLVDYEGDVVKLTILEAKNLT
jgi:hypothetical protein